MRRRSFIKHSLFGFAASYFNAGGATEHVLFLVIGGVRKKEYIDNVEIAPNIGRLAHQGFVFQQDHCDRVASHEEAFCELLQGNSSGLTAPATPSIFHYLEGGIQVDGVDAVRPALERHGSRMIVCRETANDIAHESYGEYLRSIRVTDAAVGRLFDWVAGDSRFRGSTAIVIRPEFGRDDVVNEHGQLHHSYGFRDTHRVASIFWGPDFNSGRDNRTVIRSIDMAPTLAHIFGVRAVHAEGSVVPGLFRT